VKVFLVFYDSDRGDREDWNVFYAQPEVFFDENIAKERVQWLMDNGPKGWDTHMIEADLHKSCPQTLIERAADALHYQENPEEY